MALRPIFTDGLPLSFFGHSNILLTRLNINLYWVILQVEIVEIY